MKQQSTIWILVTVIAGGYLAWRAVSYEAGAVYVKPNVIKDQAGDPVFTSWSAVASTEKGEPEVVLSWPRTLGVWISALLTLAIFSFLFGDNPVYKIAESIFVGSSAAYIMVVAFWSALMGIFVARLAPDISRRSFMPGLEETKEPEWIMLIPLAMGIMFLWRLMPVGGWISRWPLAFFIAVFAGLRLVGFFEADVVGQIKSTLLPLIVFAADGSFDVKTTLWNSTMVLGTLACLVYFFFSLEHTGIVGKISRVGIYLLMITFGVGFGLTVMSRYSLLIGRMDFLLKDWLQLGASM